MKTPSDIVDGLGGSTALGAALKIPATTVASWKSRGAIPPQHWAALVRLAREHGKSLSFEKLAGFAVLRGKERVAS